MSDNINLSGSSSLPSQKVTEGQRTPAWKKASVNYYSNFRFTNGSDLRSDRNAKSQWNKINLNNRNSKHYKTRVV